MPILTIADARKAAALETVKLQKSATRILNEWTPALIGSFDVFLSHSRLDAELVLGVKNILEASKKTVYVDWIDDAHLDRSRVTAATAEILRRRMRQCRSLLYVHSGNATKSRWMPWELGYFDGFNGNVAIVPLTESRVSEYRGEEYLGLYPYVDVTFNDVYIHRRPAEYLSFESWRLGTEKLRPSA